MVCLLSYVVMAMAHDEGAGCCPVRLAKVCRHHDGHVVVA